jgi:hypothetical protein
VRIEGQNSESLGSSCGIDHSLMADVNAIEDSQRQAKGFAKLREFFESMENLHAAMNGESRFVSTQ